MLPFHSSAAMQTITPLPPGHPEAHREDALDLDLDRPLLLPAAIQRPRNLVVLGGAVAAVLTTGILGLPVLASWLLGLGAATYSTLITVDLLRPSLALRVHGPLGPPLRPDVHPDVVDPPELRALYRGIVRAHEKLRRALSPSQVLTDSLGDVYARCGELVNLAGRVARDAESLCAHLDGQSADHLVRDADRLAACAALTADQRAATAFRAAARSRRQQVTTRRQVEGLYDRVVARLSLLAAFLDSMTALAVKLNAVEREATSAGDAVSEHLADLHSEFESLEASLEGTLAT